MKIFGREPAIWIGIIAAAILAAFTQAAGQGVVGPDVVDTAGRALDPTGGWAIPLLVAFVTRFFVSPAAKPGL